ncbi:hypothetical protein SAZ_37835 [Streptomyces noursei ZPM]|nr:hypothetical protein SAZ_37835 [Streptomyces noursei ZPM]EOS99068.1 hypothetical protein K530_35778 [Streptomyces noursei CCRC 11814]EXU87085.1 hypothetical protein P354_37865 [Streptomyces noursei PD-1]
MRTALTAALMCSAALLGPVGIAVADDHTGGVQDTGTMNFQDVNNDDGGNAWIFDAGSEHGKEDKGGKDDKGGKEAKGGKEDEGGKEAKGGDHGKEAKADGTEQVPDEE